ncbi:MAG TPA: DUF5658 family protein [Phycisphaerae bacterium]|jgi:hypothetical protein|nr:DUF5658 family protein [Phycisphaerae bacterium]
MLAVYRLLSFHPLSRPNLAVGQQASRAQRIALLLALLAVLNLVDLYCTLFAYHLGMLQELNPVAAAFLIAGLKPSFICYKLVMLIAGSTMLWKLRSSGWALPACWLLVGAYGWLAIVWYRWMHEITPFLEAAGYHRR